MFRRYVFFTGIQSNFLFTVLPPLYRTNGGWDRGGRAVGEVRLCPCSSSLPTPTLSALARGPSPKRTPRDRSRVYKSPALQGLWGPPGRPRSRPRNRVGSASGGPPTSGEGSAPVGFLTLGDKDESGKTRSSALKFLFIYCRLKNSLDWYKVRNTICELDRIK